MVVSARGFTFELDEFLTESDLVSWFVTLPAGERLRVWSQIELRPEEVILRQVAIYGADVTFLPLGVTRLRRLLDAALEAFDVRTIRIEASRRTSGAGPGRKVPAFTVRRRAT